MQNHGKKWFPKRLERSSFNQRVRNLWGVLLRLQADLAQSLPETAGFYEIVDTVPVPASSLSQSKAEHGHWFQTADCAYGGNQGRIVTTAHNLGIYLNQRWGRALLSHATLIC